MTPKQWLKGKDACADGVKFALQFSTMEEVWQKCERGDWMVWILNQIGEWTQVQKCEVAITCAAHVLKIYEKKYPKDKRPRKAIEAAKKWMKNPTEENRNAAANAAYAAADAADAAANAAAYAAAYAAAAANAAYAAYAAYAAADAADAAANAAAYAAAYAAYAAERTWQADAIRKIIPNPFTEAQ